MNDFDQVYEKYVRPVSTMSWLSSWRSAIEMNPDDLIEIYMSFFDNDKNNKGIPAEKVEHGIRTHFIIGNDHLRQSYYYDAEHHTYNLPDNVTYDDNVKVIGAIQDSDILQIELQNQSESMMRGWETAVLTIQLEEEDEFKYISFIRDNIFRGWLIAQQPNVDNITIRRGYDLGTIWDTSVADDIQGNLYTLKFSIDRGHIRNVDRAKIYREDELSIIQETSTVFEQFKDSDYHLSETQVDSTHSWIRYCSSFSKNDDIVLYISPDNPADMIYACQSVKNGEKWYISILPGFGYWLDKELQMLLK